MPVNPEIAWVDFLPFDDSPRRAYTNNQTVINMPQPPLSPNLGVVASARRARRKDARPGELLDAALDLFVEKGFAGTSAAEVAQRAGVSKGTLFLYFATKEDLFKEVVRTNISSHYPAWHEALQAFVGSTPDMLRLCVHGWWAAVGSTKASGISKLMVTEGANFPDLTAFYQREVIEPGNELIRGILQRGVERGEFAPIDMRYGVYSVLAPMLFLVLWKHSFGRDAPRNSGFIPEDYLSAQVETLLHGLCIPAGRRPVSRRPVS